MADRSSIEWTDASWNIITGCTLVDEGCRYCYAARQAATWPALANHASRKGLARVNAAGEAKFNGEVRFNDQWLQVPLRWRKPRRIFVCAAGDLFHEAVPDEWIDKVFAVMALAPQHTFQVLTKRPARAREYLTRQAGGGKQDVRNHIAWIEVAAIMDAWAPGWKSEEIDGLHRKRGISACTKWPLPNVWLGTSVSDQVSADTRIPELLAAPAAVRFISAEPLLGPVDLTRICLVKKLPSSIRSGIHIDAMRGRYCESGMPYVDWDVSQPYDTASPPLSLDWVIAGGESGPKARPMHPDWARELRDQCQAAKVPFFFKQWGEWAPGEIAGPNERPIEAADLWADEWLIRRVGKAQPDEHRDDEPDVFRVGKRLAGRLLDGREWNEMPEAPHA